MNCAPHNIPGGQWNKVLPFFRRALLLCSMLAAYRVFAQLEVVSPDEPQAVFGGGARGIKILFRNSGERPAETSLRTRLFQLSSATAMPAGAAEAWKRLTVLNGQTVLETVWIEFPDVRVATRFQIRWLDEADRTTGHTPVTVYPTNELKQLARIAGHGPPGVFDPDARLTPLLRALEMDFVDLTEEERLETFRGGLAILGVFDARRSSSSEWRKRAENLGERGVNVVLMTPARNERAGLAPPAIIVLANPGRGRIVIAPTESFARFANDPLAQGALLHCARLALDPELQTDSHP